MKKIIFLLFLADPILAFSFSETELESLESSGTKIFSQSLWRRDMGFSLIRNLDIETRHKNFSKTEHAQENKFCDTEAEGSLCDLSNLYYNLDFTIYYSLAQWAEKHFKDSFLKDTEFFLGGYFRSNFREGDCSNIEGYDNSTGYIQCGLGDILGGLTAPIYNKNSFYSYLNLSAIIWPLSKKSKDATLKTAWGVSANTIYFIKKQDKWSWAFSSNHNLAYNHFSHHKNPDSKDTGYNYNNPFDSNQQLSLIFKQNFNKYLPVNTNLFISHNFAVNTQYSSWSLQEIEEKSNAFWNDVSPEYLNILKTTTKKKCPKSRLTSVIVCGNRYQELSLGISSSWKLKQRIYLKLSAKWKDLIKAHSPLNKYFDIDKKVGKAEPPSLGLNKWYFSLRASYSF